MYWFRFTPARNAKEERHALGTSDELEAIEKAREIQERRSNTVREEMGSCEAEIKGYVAHMRANHLAGDTITSRGHVLEAFARDLKARSPRTITVAGLQRWYDGRALKNPHTAEAYLRIVHYWFEWLVGRGKMTLDLTRQVKRLKKLPMRARKRFLLAAEARKLLESCEGDLDLSFAVYCALHAGLRKNEVVEARPEWFDLKAGLLHIDKTETFQPKDRDARTIPLTDEFKRWLTKYKVLEREPFVMAPSVKHGKANKHGERTYRYDFRKAFESAVKRTGLAGVTFHDLRRTFASLLVSRGVSIYKVAVWLGDEVSVVQDSYGHLVPQDDEINKSWA